MKYDYKFVRLPAEDITDKVVDEIRHLLVACGMEGHEPITIRNLSRIAGSSYMLLVSDERGVVIAMGVLVPHLKATTSKSYVEDVMVAPEHSGRGIDLAIVTKLIEEARARHIDSVQIEGEMKDDGVFEFCRQVSMDHIHHRRIYTHRPSSN